jgi:hypothetical protein
MSISAVDNVQCVAVMGLSLKLPNVCRYLCAMQHITRIELLQLERAFAYREFGDCLSFDCGDCCTVSPFLGDVDCVLEETNGQQSKITAW